MPVHHRLRFLTFPMRTSRLCSLWPNMRPLRFRRVPFGRDVAFDPGGATASRIAMPHMLPSTVPSVSASAKLLLSWLNPPPHPITVYASHPPSPTTAQHSLPGGALPPYRGRSFTGRIASASPDAPEPEGRIHLPPAARLVRTSLGARARVAGSVALCEPLFNARQTGLDKQQAVQEKPALLACYREGINAHLTAAIAMAEERPAAPPAPRLKPATRLLQEW